jgi:hypothetical protein
MTSGESVDGLDPLRWQILCEMITAANRGDPGRADAQLLQNTLRTFFHFAADDEEVTGGTLVVAGAAALGAMLDDPAQLEAMRPHLAIWWRRNVVDFRAQGLLNEMKRG